MGTWCCCQPFELACLCMRLEAAHLAGNLLDIVSLWHYFSLKGVLHLIISIIRLEQRQALIIFNEGNINQMLFYFAKT